MSTNSISSVTPAYPPPAQNGAQQNFQALAQAVQAGNLSGAQQGLQTMQQGMKSHHAQQAYATLTQSMPQSGASANGAVNPFQQAIASIGGALQSGDVSGAQQGLQTMQQGMKSHHGHRHHAAPEQGASSPATPASTAIATVSSVAGTLDISA